LNTNLSLQKSLQLYELTNSIRVIRVHSCNSCKQKTIAAKLCWRWLQNFII